MSFTENIKVINPGHNIDTTNKKRHIQEIIIDESSKKQNAKSGYCYICNKKIGLTGIQCKCKNYFCTRHQYSDCHDCTFDYKKFNKDLLKKANPRINAVKINLL